MRSTFGINLRDHIHSLEKISGLFFILASIHHDKKLQGILYWFCQVTFYFYNPSKNHVESLKYSNAI